MLTRLVVNGDGDTDDGDKVFANTHANGTDEQETTTTEALDTPHSGEGHEHIDDVSRNRNEEGVLDAGVLEERSTLKDETNMSETDRNGVKVEGENSRSRR